MISTRTDSNLELQTLIILISWEFPWSTAGNSRKALGAHDIRIISVCSSRLESVQILHAALHQLSALQGYKGHLRKPAASSTIERFSLVGWSLQTAAMSAHLMSIIISSATSHLQILVDFQVLPSPFDQVGTCACPNTKNIGQYIIHSLACIWRRCPSEWTRSLDCKFQDGPLMKDVWFKAVFSNFVLQWQCFQLDLRRRSFTSVLYRNPSRLYHTIDEVTNWVAWRSTNEFLSNLLNKLGTTVTSRHSSLHFRMNKSLTRLFCNNSRPYWNAFIHHFNNSRRTLSCVKMIATMSKI